MAKMTEAVGEIVNQSLLLGARFEGLSSGFEMLSNKFGDGSVTLNTLRQATQGTVSDVDLLTQANRALANSTVLTTTQIIGAYADSAKSVSDWVTESVAKYGDLADAHSEMSMIIQQNLDATKAKAQAAEDAQTQIVVDAYAKQYGVTISGSGDIEGVITGHYDKLLSDSATKYSALESQTNDFYNKEISAAQEGVNAVRAAETGKLNALEETYLKQKVALEDSLAKGLISQSSYDSQVKTLDAGYYTDRSTLSDHYRLQELTAQDDANTQVTGIEADKAAALKTIEDQQKTDALKIQSDENTALSTFRSTMATITQQFANTMAAAMAGWSTSEQTSINGVISKNGDLTTSINGIPDTKTIKIDTYYNSYEESHILGGAVGGTTPPSSGTKTPTPTPTPTPSPSPAPPVQRSGQVNSWTAMASGFEGIVSSPLLALIGESGPENVSVHPVGESRGGGSTLQYNVHITGNNLTFTDPSQMMALSDYLYKDFSRRFRNDLKSSSPYMRGL